MTATTRRMRVSLLATAVVIVAAGCTSQVELTPVEPGAEPGYPHYTAAHTPDPSDPRDAASPVPETPTATASATGSIAPIPPPAQLPPLAAQPEVPQPTPDPAPAATATPAPRPDPVPVAPVQPPPPPTTSAPPTTGPTPQPPTPTETSSPVTQIQLATTTWQPVCGSALTPPRANNPLTVAATLPTLTTGSVLGTDAVLTNTGTDGTLPARFAASLTIARDGVVVSTWVEGHEAGPELSIAGRSSLVVPLTHDLMESCAGTPATPLPPGEYTAVVAIHLVHDGSAAESVVATSEILPLTIS